MVIEVPQNEKISKGEKDGERKRVVSGIHQRRANRRSINIKKKEQGGVV